MHVFPSAIHIDAAVLSSRRHVHLVTLSALRSACLPLPKKPYLADFFRLDKQTLPVEIFSQRMPFLGGYQGGIYLYAMNRLHIGT
jgi:hypothetical protein